MSSWGILSLALSMRAQIFCMLEEGVRTKRNVGAKMGFAGLCRDLVFVWNVSDHVALVQQGDEQPLKYSSVFLNKPGSLQFEHLLAHR